MSFENEQVGFDDINDDYSLESILAEYKGNAFINGSSRMAKDELEKRAREIIEEYTREAGGAANVEQVQPEAEAAKAEAETSDEAEQKAPRRCRGELIKREPAEEAAAQKTKSGIEKGMRDVEEKHRRVSKLEKKQTVMFSERELTDDEQEFFGVGKYSESVPDEEKAEIEKTIAKERKRREKRSRRAEREAEPAQETVEKEPQQELSPADARRVYGSGIASLRFRTIAVFVICIILGYLTCTGIAEGSIVKNIILGAGLLAVVLLAWDIIASGIANAFKGKFGAELLAAVSGVAALADAIWQIASGKFDYGAPYCAAAGLSILGAMWGALKGRKAYNLTFKMASQTKVPTVVSAEWERADKGTVITKNLGSAKGFVNKSVEQDLAETVYGRITPIIIAVSLVCAAICAYLTDKAAFLHCFSGIAAVSAAFGAALIFNQPFLVAVKSLFNHGAAVAGWRGACELKKAVGMVVKDLDIFPENCMTLNGLKILAPMPEEKIIAYTGSLVVASGAGTSRIFAELMREYSCSLYRVDEFSCYESGGIGAYIKGSRVWVGSAAFMNLMGIRLPQNLDIKNAVFSAIDGELAGIFIINYQPSDAVQSALLNMLHSKITPVFAIRDFNVTPALIRNKFKIPIEEGEFTTFAARYELSQNSEREGVIPAALMSREGVNHYTEIVRCGHRMVTSARLALGVTLAGTVIGMALMIALFAGGAFTAASAPHLLMYMLMWALAEYLIVTF